MSTCIGVFKALLHLFSSISFSLCFPFYNHTLSGMKKRSLLSVRLCFVDVKWVFTRLVFVYTDDLTHSLSRGIPADYCILQINTWCYYQHSAMWSVCVSLHFLCRCSYLLSDQQHYLKQAINKQGVITGSSLAPPARPRWSERQIMLLTQTMWRLRSAQAPGGPLVYMSSRGESGFTQCGG